MRIPHFLALLLMLASLPAQAFFDPPYVTPAQPLAGDMVYMNIRGGDCDTILVESGYPQITQKDNAITILWYGVRETDPLFCGNGIGTLTHPLGTYPPGDYTLTVKLTYQSRGSPTGWRTDTLGVAPFTVAGGPTPSAPIGAPTLGTFALFAIALLLAGTAAFALRCRAHWLLALLLLPPTLRAQDAPMIELLTSDASTADAVVEYFRSSPRAPTPPLPAGAVPAVARVARAGRADDRAAGPRYRDCSGDRRLFPFFAKPVIVAIRIGA